VVVEQRPLRPLGTASPPKFVLTPPPRNDSRNAAAVFLILSNIASKLLPDIQFAPEYRLYDIDVIVNRTPKPPPEKVLRIWTREWFKEGHEMDLSKLPSRPSRT
jgi:hypothetical protein